MPKFKPYLIGAICGASVAFVSLRYHVVRYDQGLLLVPRSPQPPLRSAYVDIRDWGAAMWKQYPEVAAALVSDGQGQLVAQNIAQSLLKVEEAGRLEDSSSAPGTASGPARTAPAPIRLKTSQSESTSTRAPVPPGGYIASVLEHLSRGATPSPADAFSATGRPSPEPGADFRPALARLFSSYESDGDAVAETDLTSTPTSIPSGDPDMSMAPGAPGTADLSARSVRSSIPVRPVSNPASTPGPFSGSAAARPVLDLETLDIELGEPVLLQAEPAAPRRAESTSDSGRSRGPATGAQRLNSEEPI